MALPQTVHYQEETKPQILPYPLSVPPLTPKVEWAAAWEEAWAAAGDNVASEQQEAMTSQHHKTTGNEFCRWDFRKYLSYL